MPPTRRWARCGPAASRRAVGLQSLCCGNHGSLVDVAAWPSASDSEGVGRPRESDWDSEFQTASRLVLISVCAQSDYIMRKNIVAFLASKQPARPYSKDRKMRLNWILLRHAMTPSGGLGTFEENITCILQRNRIPSDNIGAHHSCEPKSFDPLTFILPSLFGALDSHHGRTHSSHHATR
jgi:hypothetical protein